MKRPRTIHSNGRNFSWRIVKYNIAIYNCNILKGSFTTLTQKLPGSFSPFEMKI